MFYQIDKIDAPSAVDKTTDALVHLIARLVVPVMAILLFAACETPIGVAPEATSATYATSGASFSEDGDEIYVINEDGSSRTVRGEEPGVLLSAPGAKRVDLHVVGMATYDNPTAKQFRFNVRQSENGEITGTGRVTLGAHTTDVTPLCVTPYYSFGRMQYGVGVKLAEPWIQTTPWGTIVRSYVSLSITEDGRYSGMLASQYAPVCGASALLHPIAVSGGSLQVMETGGIAR